VSDFSFDAKNMPRRDLVRRVKAVIAEQGRLILTETVETWSRQMKEGRFSGYYPGNTRGKKLRVRTGALRNSVGGRVKGTKIENLRGIFRVGGSRAGYAAAQEFGADVRPKSAKMLRVPIYPPLGKALTATGRLRSGAVPKPTGRRSRTGRPVYESPRFGRTFIVRSKKGNLLIAASAGNRTRGGKFGGLRYLFALRPRVEIPARLNAGRTLEKLAKYKLRQMPGRVRVAIEKGLT
jgi:hypothetical protein